MKETRAVKWKKSDIFALMVGHGRSLDGSWDSGCVYKDYTEAGLMLPIVKRAVKWLRKSGVKVITDADDANNRNMKASVTWANNKKAKFYMSVHCDYSKATAGVMPLYKSASGRKMAVKIGKSIAKTMGMKYKGASRRTDLYELNATDMASVILETGSIKADLKSLKQYKKYGKALAKAICAFLGVKMYQSKRAKLLRRASKVYDIMTKLRFKYSWSGNAVSWAKAKKQRTSNCATYVSYILQTLGYLKAGQVFWCNDGKIRTKGKGTKARLKKYFAISHPNKSPKKAGLKKGDICGYSNGAHTQIFAGFDKKGNPLWYSFAGSDVGKHLPRNKGKYTNKKIDTILRLK